MISLKIGSILEGKYEILSLIGEGGYGLVYKAKQIDFDRLVAIKLMKDCPEEFRKRFFQEARILSKLDQPNIVSIYNIGIAPNELVYMVMEYVDGMDLSSLLQQKQIQHDETVEIGIQVCEALSYAHSFGILHRDLKPQNIMLARDRSGLQQVKLLDFGLSKIFSEGVSKSREKLTSTGSILGTPLYMSPEACAGQKTDLRSDIYSLGCILYECCSGQPPFVAENAVAILYKHGNEAPPRLTSAASSKSALALEQVILKCLAKESNKRYRSARELQFDLQLIRDGRTSDLKFATTNKKISKQYSLIIGVSILVLIFSSATIYFQMWNKAKLDQSRISGLAASRVIKQRLKALSSMIEHGGGGSEKMYNDTLAEIDKILNSSVEFQPGVLYSLYQLKGIGLFARDKNAAYKSFEKALANSRLMGQDTLQSAYSYASMARISVEFDEQQAEKSAKKAVELLERDQIHPLPKLHIPEGLYLTPGNGPGDALGMAYGVLYRIALNQHDWNALRFYVRKSISFHHNMWIPDSLMLAEMSLEMGKRGEALEQVAAIAREIDERVRNRKPTEEQREVFNYRCIGRWYELNNCPEKAATYYEKCLAEAGPQDQPGHQNHWTADALRFLAEKRHPKQTERTPFYLTF
jgi:serine/threonine protein kinase